MKNGGFSEPAARAKLLETRKAVVANWMKIAETLDGQGEVVLAGDVRYFAARLPRVLTDTERLATQFVQHLRGKGAEQGSAAPEHDRSPVR